MQSISAATEEQLAAMETMSGEAEQLNQTAQTLKALIQNFKLK